MSLSSCPSALPDSFRNICNSALFSQSISRTCSSVFTIPPDLQNQSVLPCAAHSSSHPSQSHLALPPSLLSSVRVPVVPSMRLLGLSESTEHTCVRVYIIRVPTWKSAVD